MFSKEYTIFMFGIAICLTMTIKVNHASPLKILSYRISNVDNIPSIYNITIDEIECSGHDCEKTRVGDSLYRINMRKATLKLKKEDYKHFNLPNGKEFLVKFGGTAEYPGDGNRVRNCQFTFAENNDEPMTGVPEVLKQGIFKELSHMEEQICYSLIDFYSCHTAAQVQIL